MGPQAPGQGGAVDLAALFEQMPTAYLVMDRDLVIVAANAAYLANVGRAREDLLGRYVFDAFPPTADALDESGVPRVQVSLERARDTGRPDTMPVQRYDIPDPDGAGMVERFWSLISAPVLDADGRVVLVVQRNEEITDVVRERERGRAAQEQGEAWRRRVEQVETDLYARAQELAATARAKELLGARLAGLAQVALQLPGAETVQDLVQVVFEAGLPVLGAVGGSVAVRSPGTEVLELTVTESFRPAFTSGPGSAYGSLPLDGPMPTSVAARGQAVLLPDAVAAAAHPGMAAVFAGTGARAWAALPLRVGERLIGALAVGWATDQAFPPEEVQLLEAFAAQCAQALDRLQVRQAERQAAREVQQIAQTLQRSLLTPPPARKHVRIAVGYQPASRLAQVGGDWHDAFGRADGATTIVVGDVAGHDQDAAAAMAQVRNVLRGVAQALPGSPAEVVAGLDAALAELELGVLATLVLCQLVPVPGRDGSWRLRWCNAGHPPPLLVHADGTAELLGRDPDLLVGLLREARRGEHEVVLRPGDTVLLYTDGLVETRRGDIETDLDRLRARVAPLAAGGPQALVDALLAAAGAPEDDVALLAVQVGPA